MRASSSPESIVIPEPLWRKRQTPLSRRSPRAKSSCVAATLAAACLCAAAGARHPLEQSPLAVVAFITLNPRRVPSRCDIVPLVQRLTSRGSFGRGRNERSSAGRLHWEWDLGRCRSTALGINLEADATPFPDLPGIADSLITADDGRNDCPLLPLDDAGAQDMINRALEQLMNELDLRPTKVTRSPEANRLATLDAAATHRQRLRTALEACPALVQAIACEDATEKSNDRGSSSSSSSRLVRLNRLLGSISKRRKLDMVECHPNLLADLLVSNSVKTTEYCVRNALNLSPNQYERIMRIAHSPLARIGRTNARKFFHFFRREVGLTDVQLQHIIVRRPQLFSYTIPNLQRTVSFFLDDLGLSQKQLVLMLQSMPSVLTYSIERRLRPTVEFLRDEIGDGSNEWEGWRKVVYAYPRIFSYSLETLRSNIRLLTETLSLEHTSDLSLIVSKFPPTLWLGMHNLEPKIQMLKNDLSLTEEELRCLLVTYPQVLGLSLEDNLRLKIDFFLSPELGAGLDQKDLCGENAAHNDFGCGLTRSELKEFVLYQPALLAYSLERRLRPRIKRMQQSNIRLSYSPPYVMSLTDQKFNEWLELQTTTWSVSSS